MIKPSRLRRDGFFTYAGKFLVFIIAFFALMQKKQKIKANAIAPQALPGHAPFSTGAAPCCFSIGWGWGNCEEPAA
jgi:hypothetical protein